MGVNLAYGTAGATGGGWSAQPGSIQASFGDRLPRLPANDWQARSPKTWKDRNKFVSLWPRGTFGMCGNDGSASYAPVGSDYSGAQMFEPFSCDGEVVSGADGTYTLMTEQLKTTSHYLVAYKQGSPDTAGTTVNTLLPTNVDGT